MMYLLTKSVLIISQASVIGVTAWSNSVVAQDMIHTNFNFVDLNQSNQFFEQGNQIIEEIRTLPPERKLPEIELPDNYQLLKGIDQPNSIYQQQKLTPFSRLSESETD